MRQRDIADAERAKLEFIQMIDHVQLDLAGDPGFFQLVGHQRGGERGGVQRNSQFLREIGHRADVILVRMGEHDPDQIGLALLDEIQIGEDQFGARVFIGAKGHAQIDHQPLAIAAIEVDVHADLARSAERQK